MIRQDSKSEKYFLNGRFIFSMGENWEINTKWTKLVIELKVNCFSRNRFIIHVLKDYLLVIEFNGFSWYQIRRTEINKLAVTSILNSLNLFISEWECDLHLNKIDLRVCAYFRHSAVILAMCITALLQRCSTVISESSDILWPIAVDVFR